MTKYRDFTARIHGNGRYSPGFNGRITLMCIDDEARYHVWLNDDYNPDRPPAPSDIMGGTIYKNPPVERARHDPKYFKTRKLDVYAAGNLPLVQALLEHAQPLIAEAKRRADADAAAQRAKDQAFLVHTIKRSAGPELYDALCAVLDLAILADAPEDDPTLRAARDLIARIDTSP